ncbi:hypothetical protein CANINC_002262 [Pichia inconspicua]|uniref:Ubiquitin-like modifier-activating enzyme ATG7 n=1 Tax=Pichia inconspicua TaxID=52247 RepID=A0A4T0X1M0_9ASCO|nr:hypothetical protein CANINC_002262 [[Candida] inconspicua]
MMSPKEFKFAPAVSFVESSFFVELSELKLNKYKLDTSYQDIIGYYNYNALGKDNDPSLNLLDSSFLEESELSKQLPTGSYFLSNGKLLNVNSIEEFKSLDKRSLLYGSGQTILNCIQDKSFIKNLKCLSSFLILSYADLKKYKFYYWVAFPQILSNWSTVEILPNISYKCQTGETFDDQFYILDDGRKSIETLLEYKDHDSLKVLFIDTCSYANTVSYVLRNFLAALSVHNFKNVEVHVLKYNHQELNFTILLVNDNYNQKSWIQNNLQVSGWERSLQGKLGPKIASLSSLIDPLQLATQATELNLKLMKWRLVPQLDLTIVKETKVLILGAGTLGSYIARCLIAWGVNKITFVDSGKVSFSNPVRQPLYVFDDCLKGGALKAETAASNLKKINPKLDAEGVFLDIPMIGHPIKNEEKEKRDYDTLVNLINTHDALFLALDSREARWLPTLIGNAKHKIVINSALGFESYLVMRHGSINPKISLDSQDTGRLGCYFCNDIVAPKDSLTDRTLDQMCTVTRPGVSLMASSLATELLVSVLQSPDKQYTPHIIEDRSNVLGSLPHQLRGFLHNFELLKLHSKNFQYCTACSITVVQEYETLGWEFVKSALNGDSYLEKLTGLDKFQQEAEEATIAMDLIDDSESDIS